MGKTKKEKKGNRTNPTGIPSVAEVEREAEQQPQTARTSYPIVEQLSSADQGDREFACMALSNLVFEEHNNLSILLKLGVLKKLVQNMCDTQIEVRIAAAGALRNIAIAGGVAACEELVAKDSLTPILAILQQVYNFFFQNADEKTDTDKEANRALLMQVIPLVSYLCEDSESATNIFVSSQLLPCVLPFLRVDLFPVELAIEVAKFLNVISDVNSTVAQQIISSPDTVKLLQGLLNEESLNIYLRTLVASIAYNIRSPESHLFVIKSIFPSLCKALDFDGFGTLITMEPTFATIAIPIEGEDATSDKARENVIQVKAQIELWRQHLLAQQLSLELLTNICSEDADEDWKEESDDNTTSNTGREVTIPEEIISFILSAGVFSKVLSKCMFPTPQVQAIIQKYPSVKLDFLAGVQLRAITCAGNMLLVMTLPEIGDAGLVWNLFCELCSQSLAIIDILEPVTSAMWTFLRKCAKGFTFAPTPQQFQGLFFVAKNSPSEDVRANCVGMLGIMGQQPQFHPVIQELGNILLQCLQDSSFLVVAEALNSIFDVFAEPPINEVVKQLDMMNKLTNCYQVLKPKIHSNRQSMPKDLRLRAEEALLNLGRFIEYKRQQFK